LTFSDSSSIRVKLEVLVHSITMLIEQQRRPEQGTLHAGMMPMSKNEKSFMRPASDQCLFCSRAPCRQRMAKGCGPGLSKRRFSNRASLDPGALFQIPLREKLIVLKACTSVMTNQVCTLILLVTFSSGPIACDTCAGWRHKL